MFNHVPFVEGEVWEAVVPEPVLEPPDNPSLLPTGTSGSPGCRQ